jgi:hypothetical protein
MSAALTSTQRFAAAGLFMVMRADFFFKGNRWT